MTLICRSYSDCKQEKIMNNTPLQQFQYASRCLLVYLQYEAVEQFEKSRVKALEHWRAVSKFGAQPSSNLGTWPCDSCCHICSSRIGLYTHQRMHHRQSIRRIDGAVQEGKAVSYDIVAVMLKFCHEFQFSLSKIVTTYSITQHNQSQNNKLCSKKCNKNRFMSTGWYQTSKPDNVDVALTSYQTT